ncbi:hypothetical protein C0995_005457 [Termitomyces sp. Mi166|nr:hypothetical protein C0995_005457 [Termitomyces sp. Mi166\
MSFLIVYQASNQTGRAVGQVAGINIASFTAELGGKAPILVFDDADIPSAVNGVAFASFIASGQTCVSGTRIIVQDGIYDSFISALVEKTESIRSRMGNPMNPQSTMGPIISEHHLKRIEGILSRMKGKVLCGGYRLTGASPLDGFDYTHGSFLAPTIIEGVSYTDELWQEEVFGPVIVVQRFKDVEEGVAVANDCKYGLGAGIWTSNLARAHRVAADIQTGLCWVNTHHRNDPSSPWGGMKESGIGRENGIEAFESYSQSKSTIVNTSALEEMRKDDWFSVSDTPRRYG